MSAPDGGPAFPVVASTGDPRDGVYCRDGMTIRDYFAAKALAAYITGDIEGHWGNIDDKVMRAYRAADTMLKERTR